jgi:hypothetical protein
MFSNFLHRFIFVCHLSGYLHENVLLTSIVNQGSIFGPLSFILFVNNYPKCLQH